MLLGHVLDHVLYHVLDHMIIGLVSMALRQHGSGFRHTFSNFSYIDIQFDEKKLI